MEGFIDVHCHILPGIDDGAKNMDMTREMLQIAYQEGIREIIATPHFFASKKNMPVEKVKDVFSMVEERLGQWELPIKLYLGNEIFYRREVPSKIEEGKILTLAESHYVLVEFDPGTDYAYLRDGLYHISSYGYLPILAHTERYSCLFQKKERLFDLKEQGVMIQVNGGSFSGGIFDETKKKVKYLLKEDLLDFIGTDAHRDHIRSPKMMQAASYLHNKLGKQKAEQILYENPQAIIHDCSL